MNSTEDKLRQLTIFDSCEDGHEKTRKVAALVGTFQKNPGAAQNAAINKLRTAPTIPPKPLKKLADMPQVPLSKMVKDTREPLFSQPLLSGSSLLRKQPLYTGQKKTEKADNTRSTLDNPAILEQQLEALAYHKQQMEKKGLLGSQNQEDQAGNIPKLSSTSLSDHIYSTQILSNYSNLPTSSDHFKNFPRAHQTFPNDDNVADITGTKASFRKMLSISTNPLSDKDLEEDLPPPSPVSSSYSELRRASDVFSKGIHYQGKYSVEEDRTSIVGRTYATSNYGEQNIPLKNHQNKTGLDYFGYGTLSQGSSTYDSIYEPINPRLPSEFPSRITNCNTCATYENHCQMPISASDSNVLLLSTGMTSPIHSTEEATKVEKSPINTEFSKGSGNDVHSKYNLSSIDSMNDTESYGRCFKCNERVLGESSGCTAMDQIYHISCFTCTECQVNLQGKPFYALEGQPFCEYDYLQTLEKCSVCLKPILERILRATGKPYHPQCFTCVVCRKSLDAIPFTVDAINQNYCIADFHKKFAPRCCVCQEPIMPEAGQEETVRVVALDRSFHLECYKCEDCGLLLSSEADGRGCYPLDDHVLCKSCNASRVQVLTSRMNSEV